MVLGIRLYAEESTDNRNKADDKEKELTISLSNSQIKAQQGKVFPIEIIITTNKPNLLLSAATVTLNYSSDNITPVIPSESVDTQCEGISKKDTFQKILYMSRNQDQKRVRISKFAPREAKYLPTGQICFHKAYFRVNQDANPAEDNTLSNISVFISNDTADYEAVGPSTPKYSANNNQNRGYTAQLSESNSQLTVTLDGRVISQDSDEGVEDQNSETESPEDKEGDPSSSNDSNESEDVFSDTQAADSDEEEKVALLEEEGLSFEEENEVVDAVVVEEESDGNLGQGSFSDFVNLAIGGAVIVFLVAFIISSFIALKTMI